MAVQWAKIPCPLLAEQGEPELRGRDELVWLDRFDRELDNFRASLTWTRDQGHIGLGLELAGSMTYSLPARRLELVDGIRHIWQPGPYPWTKSPSKHWGLG
jgi:hypothetical protein